MSLPDVNTITAYSTALAAFGGICTAIATIGLAYFNREYIKQVDKQSVQIRGQAKFMAQKMELDLLEKKHDRLTYEMRFLIAPLFAKLGSPSVWRLFVPAKEDKFLKEEHYSFWENIKENMHYARDSYLQENLKNIFEIFEKFRKYGDRGGLDDQTTRKFEDDFKHEIENLQKAITNRYGNLCFEIYKVEMSLDRDMIELKVDTFELKTKTKC